MSTTPNPNEAEALTAVGADPTHVEGRLDQLEAMLIGGCFTGMNHGSTFKFLGATAANANEVMVVAMITG